MRKNKLILTKVATVTLAGSIILTSPVFATSVNTMDKTVEMDKINVEVKDNIEEEDKSEKDIESEEETEKDATVESIEEDIDQPSLQTQYENKVLELVNKEREKRKLKPLTMDEEIEEVARLKATDMYKNHYFSHISPTYGSPSQMLKNFKIVCKASGENIAYGQRTPEEVVRDWMNSAGHRANILNANYTKIGIGFEENGFFWTQLFSS